MAEFVDRFLVAGLHLLGRMLLFLDEVEEVRWVELQLLINWAKLVTFSDRSRFCCDNYWKTLNSRSFCLMASRGSVGSIS